MKNINGYLSSGELPCLSNYLLIHTEWCDQRTMWLYISKTEDMGIVSLSYRVSPDLISWSGTLEKTLDNVAILKYPKAILKLERTLKIRNIKNKIKEHGL